MNSGNTSEEIDVKSESPTKYKGDGERNLNAASPVPSAGVDSDCDQSRRSQRQHFPDKSSSNIFFGHDPAVTYFSKINSDEIQPQNSDEIQAQNNDEIQPQISDAIEDPSDDGKKKEAQRQHFPDRSSSNIFFGHDPAVTYFSKIQRQNSDEIQSQISDAIKDPSDVGKKKEAQRTHFPDRNSSNIFYGHDPAVTYFSKIQRQNSDEIQPQISDDFKDPNDVGKIPWDDSPFVQNNL